MRVKNNTRPTLCSSSRDFSWTNLTTFCFTVSNHRWDLQHSHQILPNSFLLLTVYTCALAPKVLEHSPVSKVSRYSIVLKVLEHCLASKVLGYRLQKCCVTVFTSDTTEAMSSCPWFKCACCFACSFQNKETCYIYIFFNLKLKAVGNGDKPIPPAVVIIIPMRLSLVWPWHKERCFLSYTLRRKKKKQGRRIWIVSELYVNRKKED